MQAASVAGLIRRRGSVIQWWHAIAPDPSSLNPMTGQPEASLGGPKLPAGTFGEGYPTDPVLIRGFVSNKFVMPRFAPFGVVEDGDLQLSVPVPFIPEPQYDIDPLPSALLNAYTAGNFAVTIGPNTPYTDQRPTMIYDRFGWGGRIFIAKSRPIPLVDNNVTFAWRIQIAEFSL